ncbi:MAG TPA: hypothetical protein VJX94_01065 [Stellaceae bacterium]|nr:hypothetical protein [Stellaceae bacterium]
MNGSPAAAMQSRIGSASPNENKISGSPLRLRHSNVTIESFPPPTGTQIRRCRSSAIGAARAGADHLISKCPLSETRFLKANSAKPFS